MRHFVKNLVAAAVAVGALLGAKSAMAAAGEGVVFVHGTGDYTQATAKSEYWTQSSIDSMRNGHAYLVVGYKGASCAANSTCSWGDVTNQIATWATANGINSIVVVTHSNGSNPLRYMLTHPTANTGTSYGSRTVSTVTSKFQKLIWLAGDNMGTQLADKVTTPYTFAALANSVLALFGGGYDKPAVYQQRRADMATYNSNGTFSGSSYPCGYSTTCGGKTTQYVAGTNVYALVFSGDANCGGYGSTTGLKASMVYAFGYSACADGFLPCDSQRYNGSMLLESDRLNHNQSRRSCKGTGTAVSNSVYNTIGYTATPADYNVSPAALACNTTQQGWISAAPYAGNFYKYGCTAAQRSDSSTDHDCLVSYGADNGVVVPNDFASTAFANPIYYDQNTVCPDSWAGDGVCDLCLLAKYGYDVPPGGAGTDDCVNLGPGTTNTCSDLVYYDTAGEIGLYEYPAPH